jgi:ABC-type multidrug transport system fused ATPase/permease subunit
MELASLFKINKKAFTAIIVGSIMGILIGAVMLIVTYAVLSPIVNIGITAMNSTIASSNSTLSLGFTANMGVITQALTITGISLIVAGVAGIIYMLMGVAGMTGGGRGR